MTENAVTIPSSVASLEEAVRRRARVKHQLAIDTAFYNVGQKIEAAVHETMVDLNRAAERGGAGFLSDMQRTMSETLEGMREKVQELTRASWEKREIDVAVQKLMGS